MNMATVIAVVALAAVIFLAVRYIVKEKKRGVRCIGCPYAGTCSKADSGCSDDPDELYHRYMEQMQNK
jgi:hypothetical protein